MEKASVRIIVAVVLMTAWVTVGSGPTLAAQQGKADNTAANKGDQAKGAVTADQQTNAKSDVETTRQIRRAIAADKSLSTYAHNIKIITQHGKVTLRGPVRSDVEKAEVQAKAIDVAGAPNVTNELSIAPAKTRAKK
jgi:hyperosmotically inducible periplasmic protein